jgi:hypothetical protein
MRGEKSFRKHAPVPAVQTFDAAPRRPRQRPGRLAVRAGHIISRATHHRALVKHLAIAQRTAEAMPPEIAVLLLKTEVAEPIFAG